MRRIVLLAGMLTLATSVLASEDASGRFQLFQGKISVPVDSVGPNETIPTIDAVFLIDTRDGNIFRYNPSGGFNFEKLRIPKKELQ